MGFSPRGTGDRSAIHCRFYTDSGNLALPAGVATSDLAMHFIDSRGHFRAGTGVWSDLLQDGNGLWSANYTPSADDVALADTYKIYPVVPDAVNGSPRPLDPQTLRLDELP